jgi:hypothetical protein
LEKPGLKGPEEMGFQNRIFTSGAEGDEGL